MRINKNKTFAKYLAKEFKRFKRRLYEKKSVGKTMINKNSKCGNIIIKKCKDNKHYWGDVTAKDGTIGCCLCDSRKKVSKQFAFELGQAHRMEANYTFRDEY